MIRVFISYCNESDGETATSLYHYLDQEEKIEPKLAPIDREIVIENAEKIANEIDICNYFITFYTRNGKENIWVNQELGYAFNHVRQNNFKIIPIFNNRSDFDGFLTSRSHNFYGGFQLNEEEPKRTME
ncbi:MAG: toll/interleukin-1 receptor domain-containing protein [Methanosarcinales archaeon]|nr:toll/interleukin-1 receptor domain-containing protein [Methanosarcinales archaeon]